MRILVLDTFYASFLREHYRARPGLAEEKYAAQWRSLMDQSFGTADSYSYFLAQLGHEAHEVVANCEPLQAAWAREHDLPGPGRTRLLRSGRLERILAAQVEGYRPDVLYVQNLLLLDPRALRRLGRNRLVVGQIASEPPPDAQLRAFDLLLTSFPHFVGRFRALGVPSEYFRIGFDPRALERIGAQPRDLETIFVGSLRRGQHGSGNALLGRVADRLPLEVWGPGSEEWPKGSALRRSHRGEAWGIEMLRLLGRARIALNRHIDVAGDDANNMRLYEATGMGALLLTDAKRNLGELFEVGREVLAYRDEDELVRLATHFLEHEDERAEIAAAGQARTLAEHTYEHRMQELVEILERHVS